MLRSLVSLFLLASVNATPLGTSDKTVTPFNPADLLSVNLVANTDSVSEEPVIEARAATVIDANTGIVLYEKNAHTPVPMASLTKIMTAVLIMDNHDLDEVVTVQNNFSGIPLGVRIWLNQYEKITVGDLLIGLLVRSGGDAAVALAEYHSGSVGKFVGEMNQKAQNLKLENTRFANPIGIDHEDQFSTAHDLAVLTKYALHHPDFRRIIQMPRASISSVDGQITHEFESTNYLLGDTIYEVLGGKTGTTEAAGPCLINLVRGPKGQEIITVLLNSPARYTETRRLIYWAFDNVSW